MTNATVTIAYEGITRTFELDGLELSTTVQHDGSDHVYLGNAGRDHIAEQAERALREIHQEAGQPRYETVYRCKYEGLDPAGCDWSSTSYAAIDAHEDQTDRGHWVTGQMEKVEPS